MLNTYETEVEGSSSTSFFLLSYLIGRPYLLLGNLAPTPVLTLVHNKKNKLTLTVLFSLTWQVHTTGHFFVFDIVET